MSEATSWEYNKCVLLATNAPLISNSSCRLVDGEVHTPELKTVLGWNDDLPMKDVALQLKRMAISFEEQHQNDGNELCQAISSEVPRIYHILNRVTLPYDVESVKSTLHLTPWLWMGDR